MSNFADTHLNFINIFLSFLTFELNIQEYNHKMICIYYHGIKCDMSMHLFGTKLVSLGQLADEIYVNL